MSAPDLFSWTPPIVFGPRDGETFEPKRDTARLNAQMQRVYSFMCNGEWFTLHELSYWTGAPEASVSARIRDLKKSKFGGFKIEKRHVGGGLWQYRLLA